MYAYTGHCDAYILECIHECKVNSVSCLCEQQCPVNRGTWYFHYMKYRNCHRNRWAVLIRREFCSRLSHRLALRSELVVRYLEVLRVKLINNFIFKRFLSFHSFKMRIKETIENKRI